MQPVQSLQPMLKARAARSLTCFLSTLPDTSIRGAFQELDCSQKRMQRAASTMLCLAVVQCKWRQATQQPAGLTAQFGSSAMRVGVSPLYSPRIPSSRIILDRPPAGTQKHGQGCSNHAPQRVLQSMAQEAAQGCRCAVDAGIQLGKHCSAIQAGWRLLSMQQTRAWGAKQPRKYPASSAQHAKHE